MRLLLTRIIFTLSICTAFTGISAAEETVGKPKFMGVFKGSFMGSYPEALVVKRFLISNGAYAKKKRTIDEENTVQKMSTRILNDFISKGSQNCKSQYYLIEEVSTALAYNQKGALLVNMDANVVCFNSDKPL